MTDLSPAAQAILAAMEEINLDIEEDNNLVAAAALRALADAVVPADQSVDRVDRLFLTPGDILWDDLTASIIRHSITAIATELENHD